MYSFKCWAFTWTHFLLFDSPGQTKKKNFFPLMSSDGGSRDRFRTLKSFKCLSPAEKQEVGWWGAGLCWWTIGWSSGLWLLLTQSACTLGWGASSSHVGTHPGLTVGGGQFALAPFSGWRLRSGHDMGELFRFQSRHCLQRRLWRLWLWRLTLIFQVVLIVTLMHHEFVNYK